MNTQKILADAWYFYTLNFRYLLYLCIPFVFAEALLSEGFLTLSDQGEQTISIGYYVAQLGIHPLYTAILIQFLQVRTRGLPVDRAKVVSEAFALWPMMVLLVVMKFVLFMIGLLLFILPGIWIAVRMAFAEFYLVEKREQPVESMRSSFTATEQPFWTIVVVFLVPQALLILLQFLLKSFVVALGNLFILNVLLHMALVMLSLYITIAFYRIYMQPEGES
ncbi:MAG: YciC family protein [Gammaproteobacteria bacterium]|jgi:hypothetical protein